MSLFGIDVSKWQTTTPDLSTCEFLFARASIGTTRDTMYPVHIGNAKVAGIVTGAYHFNWDTISIPAQVTTFIAAAGNVDLYALDVEGANAFSVAQSREFIRLMHEAGLKCGLYHSASGFFDAGQDFDWVAKWSPIPPASWDFWQYSSDGHLPGYAGRLDFDRFNGTLSELHALAGMTGPDTGTDGRDMAISTTGLTLASDKGVTLPVGTNVHEFPDGASKIGEAGGPVPYFGTPGNEWKAVRVNVRGHSEIAYVKTAATIYDTEPIDCAAQIAADRQKAYIAYKP